MTDPDSSKVNSLRQLPADIPPSRDLWPQLEARLGAEIEARRARRFSARRWAASFAALAAAVAVGVWIGRGLLPGTAAPVRAPGGELASNLASGTRASGAHARTPIVPYVTDPRYLQTREAMLKTLPEMLARLPPPTRAKVVASLATIQRSMLDIQAALGRDPGDALLQELLVDTYQDEMRVLTTVQEASGPNGEI